jgi:hypothetical protein
LSAIRLRTDKKLNYSDLNNVTDSITWAYIVYDRGADYSSGYLGLKTTDGTAFFQPNGAAGTNKSFLVSDYDVTNNAGENDANRKTIKTITAWKVAEGSASFALGSWN